VSGYQVSTTIDAPIDLAWSVLVDVERMPEWTTSMRSVRLSDGEALRQVSRVHIKQPWLRATTWTVDVFDPPRHFSWRSRTGTIETVASHLLEDRDQTNGCNVRHPASRTWRTGGRAADRAAHPTVRGPRVVRTQGPDGTVGEPEPLAEAPEPANRLGACDAKRTREGGFEGSLSRLCGETYLRGLLTVSVRRSEAEQCLCLVDSALLEPEEGSSICSEFVVGAAPDAVDQIAMLGSQREPEYRW
jgi:Polyketide cyclase / dehydrase and lipid transport